MCVCLFERNSICLVSNTFFCFWVLVHFVLLFCMWFDFGSGFLFINDVNCVTFWFFMVYVCMCACIYSAIPHVGFVLCCVKLNLGSATLNGFNEDAQFYKVWIFFFHALTWLLPQFMNFVCLVIAHKNILIIVFETILYFYG